MTIEDAIKFGKAYKLYFSTDTYDYPKYRGEIKTRPLLQQRDRALYYRLSHKLNDAQVHATLLYTYFYNPHAYITDALTPQAIDAGIALASRAELGERRLAMDLYDLRKRVTPKQMEPWLYAPMMGTQRAGLPVCIEELIARTLPIDLACLLLLIPQNGQCFVDHWTAQEPAGSSFGVRPWLTRLHKADQLLYLYRSNWRQFTHKLSSMFWQSYPTHRLIPVEVSSPTQLFS